MRKPDKGRASAGFEEAFKVARRVRRGVRQQGVLLFCREPLSLETISAVFPYDESVCFCCGRPECCNAMLNLEQEER